jgi:hypothetical protein
VFEDGATQISGRGSAEVKVEVEKVNVPGLRDGKENKMGKRVPAKQGRIDMNALLGKRPVLRDIVNDVS